MQGHLPSQVDAMTIPDYAMVKATVDAKLDQMRENTRGSYG
jgi:hypothetical protein